MTTQRKSKVRSISLQYKVFEKLEEMKKYYGVGTSTMVTNAINSLYGGAFRKEYLGYQGGTAASTRRLDSNLKISATAKLIQRLDGITDPDEFHEALIGIGYYKEEEVLPDYTIINYIAIEGNTLRHMIKTGDSLSTGPTKEEIVDKILKKKVSFSYDK